MAIAKFLFLIPIKIAILVANWDINLRANMLPWLPSFVSKWAGIHPNVRAGVSFVGVSFRWTDALDYEDRSH